MRKWWFSIRGEPAFLLVVMLAVPFIFKTIPDKKTASLVASSLFLISGLLCLRQSLVNKSKLLKVVSLVFLIGFSLPIIGLRLFNWEVEFSQLSLLGIPGEWFHKVSTWVFIAMLGVSLGVNWSRRPQF